MWLSLHIYIYINFNGISILFHNNEIYVALIAPPCPTMACIFLGNTAEKCD